MKCNNKLVLTEPGYYEDGNFGIRIENALLCKNADTKVLSLCFIPLVPTSNS